MRNVTKWVLVAVFAIASGSFADQTKQVKASDFTARMEVLKNETREQISTLEEQMASLTATEQESVQAQIMDLKRNAEISRLEILLEWARAENNDEKILEVEQALNNWLNPQVQKNLPEISRDKSVAPGTSQPDSK